VWEFYPENKGLYSGILLGAYGFSPFVFSQVTTKIVNPENLDPTIIILNDNGEVMIKFYGSEVANNTPKMLEFLAVVFAIFGILSVLLINRRPQVK
jgi:hypothetical protein